MRRAHQRADRGTALPVDPEAQERAERDARELDDLREELQALKARDLAAKRSEDPSERPEIGRAIYDLMRAIRALREDGNG